VLHVRPAKQMTGGWLDSPDVGLVSAMSVTGQSS